MIHHRHLPAVSGLALAAAAVLGLAAPSQAAFPGRNGKIAVAFFDDPGGGAGAGALGHRAPAGGSRRGAEAHRGNRLHG